MALIIKVQKVVPDFDQHNVIRWIMGPLLIIASYLVADPIVRFCFMRPTARVVDSLMKLGLPEEDVWDEVQRSIAFQVRRHPILWFLIVNLTWTNPLYVWKVLTVVAALEMHERGADVDVVEV